MNKNIITGELILIDENYMKSVSTYTAKIYCGLRIGYSDIQQHYDKVRDCLQEYCDKVGMCFALDKTEYIYKNGSEMGVTVTIITYPRMPVTPAEIKIEALLIANILMVEFKQFRVSVVFPDETIMITNNEMVEGENNE